MPRPSARFMTSPKIDYAGREIHPLGAFNEETRLVRERELIGRIEAATPLPDAVFSAIPHPDNGDAVCRMAGLACTWAVLNARSRSIGKVLPGIRFADEGEAFRLWCLKYAPDLIDETVPQPDYAILWGWW